MSITQIIAARSIRELLHFTTNRGLTGVLATRFIKARARLTQDDYLEHIVLFNCPDRSRDEPWHGHVNVSISCLAPLFKISKDKWHAQLDGWWCILSLSPELLTHDDVVFCTTNNMYSGCIRNRGPEGLEALFAPRIVRWSTSMQYSAVERPRDCELSLPTCAYAEALYPQDIGLSYLQRIYVSTNDHLDAVHAMFAALDIPAIPCDVRPHLFE